MLYFIILYPIHNLLFIFFLHFNTIRLAISYNIITSYAKNNYEQILIVSILF